MRRKCSWSIVVVCGIALVAFLLTGQARLWGQWAGEGTVSIAASDSFLYRLELSGLLSSESGELFSECSGLGSSSDIEEQKIVTDKGVVAWQMSPGALRWNSITLKRDSLSGTQIWQWRKSVEDGKLTDAIKSGTIVMLGSNSAKEYARWTFRNGWPAKLSFDEGVQELVIVHDGLELVTPGTGGTTAVKKR
jgi:phage tail-like protein